MSDLPLNSRSVRREMRQKRIVLCITVLIAVLVAGTFAYYLDIISPAVIPPIVAMVIGGAVGTIEIMGRYQYSPIQAVMTVSGAAYILINVVASAAAYYLIGVFSWLPDAT